MLNKYESGAWSAVGSIYRWTGSAWAAVTAVKRWTGSAWIMVWPAFTVTSITHSGSDLTCNYANANGSVTFQWTESGAGGTITGGSTSQTCTFSQGSGDICHYTCTATDVATGNTASGTITIIT